MADQQESSQERTEEPTAKRLREAREKGQIARSRELNTMVGILASAGGLYLFGGYMRRQLVSVMRDSLTAPRGNNLDPYYALNGLHDIIIQLLVILAPFLSLVLIASLLAPTFLGGFSFSWKAMAPKPEKLNPVKGLKNLFALRGLMEVGKSLAKFAIMGFITWRLLHYFEPRFLHLGIEPFRASLLEGATLVILAMLAFGGGLVGIALVDVPFQLWNHRRQLKMTRQEVKDEQKETEGRPEVKSKIRQIQQEQAQRRMMEDVPAADVVVTNPTHYAVALRYDENRMAAPRVVAKGADHIAAEIRKVAGGHHVPLVAAPPLARALYSSTRIGREIPTGLYMAVAQILTYIHRLHQATVTGAPMPDAPNPEIGSEFKT